MPWVREVVILYEEGVQKGVIPAHPPFSLVNKNFYPKVSRCHVVMFFSDDPP